MFIPFGSDGQQEGIKMHILDKMGLSRDIALKKSQVGELIKVARVACLNDMELYFGIESADMSINPRNEAAALSLLLQELTSTSGVQLPTAAKCPAHAF
jgi:hypothetical protein